MAVGDVNGDGTPDLITGAGVNGGPHVKVFDGATGEHIRSSFPFDANFRGGVNVGAGDFNNDGFGDIIVGVRPGFSFNLTPSQQATADPSECRRLPVRR